CGDASVRQTKAPKKKISEALIVFDAREIRERQCMSYVLRSVIWKFEVWLRKPNPYAQRDISEPTGPRVIPTAEESHAKRVEIFSRLKLEGEEFDLI
ncbi:MAG: hypothetical protein WA750_14635, partial [Pseudolabrys sp.]